MTDITDHQYKELFFAAKAFIDCHAADPDLTNEMCDRYREYCDLLQRYNPVIPENISQSETTDNSNDSEEHF